MSITSVSFKDMYIDELTNIPGYTKCTKIPDIVKQEMSNLGIITIHDFITQVGANKVKVAGMSSARYRNIMSIIVQYLIVVYGDGVVDNCIYNSEWNSWFNNYQVYHSIMNHIPLDRAMELLNAMIDHLSVAERNDEVIKKLLNIGFTEDELINKFNFCEDDVKEVAAEMEEDEE